MKSFFATLRMVLWAMLGVRSVKGRDIDVKKTSPLIIMIVGFMFFIFFILAVYGAAKYASGI